MNDKLSEIFMKIVTGMKDNRRNCLLPFCPALSDWDLSYHKSEKPTFGPSYLERSSNIQFKCINIIRLWVHPPSDQYR